MDLSNINSGLMTTMVQMKQNIDLKMKDVVEKANEETGNPLGVSYEFSKPSELMAKLTQLENENPEKFKELMQDISDLLEKASEEASAASSKTTGTSESSFLSMLSDKFANAAKTGDVSSLQAGGRGGATHAAGVGGASSASTCAACGASIPEGSSECPKCGAPVQSSQMMNIGKNEIDEALTSAIEDANAENGSPLGDISGLSPKEIMDKIKELQETDPEKYKALMSSISENLKEAADSADATGSADGGGFGAGALADLSDKFAQAAETGELPDLQPPPPINANSVNPRVALYMSDSSSGAQKSLFDLLTAKNTDDENDPLNAIRNILKKALEVLDKAASEA